MCARTGACVRACARAFKSVNFNTKSNTNLPSNPTVTTTAFQPQSKAELQDAVQTCGVDTMFE